MQKPGLKHASVGFLSEHFQCVQIESNISHVGGKNILANLMPFTQATQPVQEYMNMPLDAQRLQHETAKYLPQSLYILYVQASAYSEACDPNLEVKILGDLDVAKAAVEAKVAARGLSLFCLQFSPCTVLTIVGELAKYFLFAKIKIKCFFFIYL